MTIYKTFLSGKNSFVQAILICFMYVMCDFFVQYFTLPVPGGILGLILVLILLMSKRLAVKHISKGAHLLLKEMVLFFIPAVLAVLDHHEFLSILGLKILSVILLSTTAVILITALIVDYYYHRRLSYAKPVSQ